MRRILLILALGVTITMPTLVIAQDAVRVGHVFYFATGWRVNEPVPQNVLQLGILFRCEIGWCVEFEEFAGKENLPRTWLAYSHEMAAPYGKQNCKDEHLTTIHGGIHRDLPAQIIKNERGFILKSGSYEYVWERDVPPGGGYIIAEARGIDSGALFDQPVGYAYESEEQTEQKIRPEELSAYFDGQIFHKNMLMGVTDEWSQKQSSMDFRKFRRSPVRHLMEFDQPAIPDVVLKYKKPAMWVHHSVLIPSEMSQRLNYVLHEYGHDFNANGCFDDFGHNKLMLPVRDRGLISAFVYVEYSPDMRDGVPMISVGRYFRKR